MPDRDLAGLRPRLGLGVGWPRDRSGFESHCIPAVPDQRSVRGHHCKPFVVGFTRVFGGLVHGRVSDRKSEWGPGLDLLNIGLIVETEVNRADGVGKCTKGDSVDSKSR